MLEAVVSRNVRCDYLQLMHVSCKEEGGPTPHPTPPTQEEGTTGGGENTIESSDVIEDFVEENNV